MSQHLKGFAVLILTYGRADRVITYETLRKQGYTGRIFLVCSTDDKELAAYRARFGDEVIAFSKDDYAPQFDIGDNFEGQNVVVFARNAAPDIAKNLGLTHYLELDDDYNSFRIRVPRLDALKTVFPKNLNRVFASFVDFMRSTKASCIAMAQSGDFLGGKDNDFFDPGYVGKKRKIMNSFFNAVDRPFQFYGRINEDVNCYIENGKRGMIFVTHPLASVNQLLTQTNSGGLTDIYLSQGTYVKSFYTVLYNPSAVTVQKMNSTNPRIHHRIVWRNAVPYIIREKHKKYTKTAAKQP